MPLNTNQVLQDRYRIDALLGQGGMGAVYRATDLRFDAPVAIKENQLVTPESQKQFAREAGLLYRLRHPNLPRVIDHFYLAGQGQYLVMDYVEGEDLNQVLARQGALPMTLALDWIGQVLDALEYLHGEGIIHRDVKPANVKITPKGQVFLVDFGLAKVYDPLQKTTIGARGATPGYAPPEQYGQGRTDARTDVYSVGATLYALLTGRVPPDALECMMRRAELRPPRGLNPEVSPRLEDAILRAMQPAPDDRFQTAGAFRAALPEPPTQLLGARRPPPAREAPEPQPVEEPPPPQVPTPARQPAVAEPKPEPPKPRPEIEPQAREPQPVRQPPAGPRAAPRGSEPGRPPVQAQPARPAPVEEEGLRDVGWQIYGLFGLLGLALGLGALGLLIEPVLLHMGLGALDRLAPMIGDALLFLLALWGVPLAARHWGRLARARASHYVLGGAALQVAMGQQGLLPLLIGRQASPLWPAISACGLGAMAAGVLLLYASLGPAARWRVTLALAVGLSLGTVGSFVLLGRIGLAGLLLALSATGLALLLVALTLRRVEVPPAALPSPGPGAMQAALRPPGIYLLGIVGLAGVALGTAVLYLYFYENLVLGSVTHYGEAALVLAGCVAALLIGRAAGRWRRDRLLAGSLLITSAGLFATGLSPLPVPHLLPPLIGTLIGLGSVSALGLAGSLISSQPRAPLLWTATVLGFVLGVLVYPPLVWSGRIGIYFGLNSVLGYTALLPLLALPLAWLAFRAGPALRGPQGSG